MAVTSDVRRVGETLKAKVDETVDQASRVASETTEALRQRGSELAERAQGFYDDLEGDDPGAKLRTIVTDYPLASLAVAAAAGFLLARYLRR